MSIGTAVSRVEGLAKVTGQAKFAADNTPPGTLHAALVGAPVASGRLIDVDATAALALPGVVRVLTAHDMPRFGAVQPPAAVLALPLQNDAIRYEGEPVAIVLAESIEAAEAGRDAVLVRCERDDPILPGAATREPPPEPRMLGDDLEMGDVDAILGTAQASVAATYIQAARHHNAMETSGTVARFEHGKLTLWDAVQASENVPLVVAAALGMRPDDIHVIAPHTGGGFGSKGYVWPHQILAAAAARVAGRPVKLHLRRHDQFVCVGYQPWMKQDIKLAATADGRLSAIDHEIVNSSAIADTHLEPASEASKTLYASPAIRTKQWLERRNINVPTPMRAPVEGPGLWALESAMDELAVALKIDPLDLRLANYAEVDPHTNKPWSSKKLREAYEEGARLYGWRTRGETPRRDGAWRIGHGMATSSMGNFRFPGGARVRLRSDGTALIEANTHDIGTGTQTVFCQIAAEELGLPIEKVSIVWGDTNLHPAGPVYGSSATGSTGSAIALACREINAKLDALGGKDVRASLRQANLPEMVADGAFTLPGGASFSADGDGTPYAMRTWGAIFVEVGVDPELGLVRLRRAVGAYSAGRIINPKTARSQMTGAIIWGWGKATMEESVQEPNTGGWLAKNLSNVAVPVNADIPLDIKIHFVSEYDPHASAIGTRGIGELGATGVDAAVAAAVYDAIGLRVRDLPILPGKILAGLSSQHAAAG
ncbi:xanthine dehydrogenase YagR molybdenum-binding subunit [Paraburkholderia sp. WSM4175]|uniref:xanthine dehydrogenase family protein molybdopterin-binding subunit n=1 Tax=Paraburkholderia sp. WSM4175 TaxID=2991072 RepID=UPI003D2582A2